MSKHELNEWRHERRCRQQGWALPTLYVTLYIITLLTLVVTYAP